MRLSPRYQFTTNWALRVTGNWAPHLMPLAGTPLLYLEIGVFEGRSGCWMLDNVLTHPESRYIGIDVWAYRKRFSAAEIEQRARTNLDRHADKVELLKGPSQRILRDPCWQSSSIDVGYIDGDHGADAVLTDSVLLWPLIKPGGILIWDDYRLRRRLALRTVKTGVDAFLSCIQDKFDLLFTNNQIGIRKH